MDSTKGLARGKTFIAGGVCAGLAKRYGLNKGGVQAAFILTSLLFVIPILIYVVLWMILPKDD